MQLERAQQTLAEKRAQVNPRYKPAFHQNVPAGWLNDPNGFGFYQGKAHLFYQYHPYDSVWGPMHWGHWISEDLVRWEELPVALAPDTPADEGGCFSGTALEENGKLYLIYTGLPAKDETGKHLQQQCIAESSDGIRFEKWAQNPVIGKELLPDGVSPYEFRDPKIQKIADEYRVITAAMGETCGKMLAFRSSDLRNWRFSGVYADNLGFMSECPDAFELDGKNVAIVYMMGANLNKYPSRQPVLYMVGREENDHLIYEGDPKVVDWGMDFYAPQTTRTPDGRQVLIGWALSWGHVMPTHTLGHGWAGMMTLPRELSLDENGELCQKPIAELAKLRKKEVTLQQMVVSGMTELPEFSGNKREFVLDVDMTNADGFEMQLLKTGDEAVSISYVKDTGMLKYDRSRCGYPATADLSPENPACCVAEVPLTNGHLKLQLFVDVSIVEIFADEGRKALTSLAFPKGDDAAVSLCAQGTAVVNMTSWEMV